ncbi:type II secretion system GspH family protein [Aerococcus urinae]|uniref:type II secretion system protein n=1 Tax=Aerococcus urinae TaxID=1376 RepID=UPI00227A5189|nr:type II secretion system protein [Aerococcus urinae]MCY3060601.1 type II secretion system GspH family protein [Aerococcus urinae]
MKVKSVQTKAGMTLLSMVLTLFIVGVILTVTMIQSQKVSQNLAVETCLQKILQSYEACQKEAIIKGEYYYLYFLSDQVRIMQAKEGQDPYIKDIILLPKNTRIQSYQKVSIQPGTGYIQPRTVTLRYPQRRYMVKFQLGVGKYVVEKRKE